jgi:hypothetical protein
MTENHETVKHIMDALSFMTVLGAMTAWLPPVASLFTIIWMAIRIWETDTVCDLTNRKRKSRAIDQ